MKVAIVGSREKYLADPGKVREQVRLHVDALPPETIIVSGAADGVDTYAADAAEECGLVLIEYPAQWRPGGKLDRAAGFKRNALIVAQADAVHAFWDGRSPGTAQTIALARRRGVHVEIYPVRKKALDV